MQKEPEPVLNWCRNLVNTLRDRGMWGIPRSGLVFQIDKKKNRLVLTSGDETNSDFSETRRVFAQIGWEVVTQIESEDTPDAGPTDA